ncbi:MAG: acyltransferase family protein [Porphyromonas somerae]|uniref:acyltransferase family protein n=1 Tax=Porphyromonas somerae TaxID=322095 RepID=UPI0026F0A849|nr:acyltransferase family protein [Porphyromonas somerae]MDD7558264.1 acyltransferase family protein [Porphyromonas somerae]MDY5816185.1 acyltransferase family protein [Porphyromonas somerae]
MVDYIKSDLPSNGTEIGKGRVGYLDALKFIAIYFVIWGHACQYGFEGTINNDIYHPATFFINSFHMPLFMMLSGVFASSSLKRTFGPFLLDKVRQLLIPAFLWSLIAAVILFLRGKNYFELYGVIGFITDYWFVKCLFICFLLYWVSIRLLKNEFVACLVTIALVLIIPKGSFVWVSSMLPFFWMGHFFKKGLLTKKVSWLMVALVGLGFVICLLGWSRNYTIYLNGSNFFSIVDGHFDPYTLFVMAYRFLIGTLGSLTFILLVKKVYPLMENWKGMGAIQRAGQETLGIYMVHVLLLVFVAHFYAIPNSVSVWLYDFLFVHIYNLIGLFGSLAIIYTLNRYRVTRVLLLGKRR